jgi:deazaflavin-dependent oxidoreductase (nitroreductase family)
MSSDGAGLDPAILSALTLPPSSSNYDRTIDMTTTGARTGLARRIEISIWQIDERWYIASGPGPRDWLANLKAQPRFTVHLKRRRRSDLPATATVVTSTADRRRMLAAIIDQAGRTASGAKRRRQQLDEWAAKSPLIEVIFDGN